MRTSSQLDMTTDKCEHNKHTSLTSANDNLIRAYAEKSIIKRILEGEPIDDIQTELDSICKERNIVWENYEQRLTYLMQAEAAIKKYCDFEQLRNNNRYFPTGIDTTIDYFGEQIDVRPDFFIYSPESPTVTICKIKTSAFNSAKADREKNETYCLGMLGKKLFPDKDIVVEYDHLRDSSATKRTRGYNPDAPYETYDKQTSLFFAAGVKRVFEEKHAAEASDTHKCSPSECAACPMNNICNYEEAPLAVTAEEIVTNRPNPNPTASQRDVINFNSGIARVNAGAGAGKTMTVSKRVAKLVEDGTSPEKICLLTFTKTGAAEMTERAMREAARAGFPIDPDKLTSTTINAFCQQIVTDNYETLGYQRPPRVIPDANRFAIINRLIDTYPKISNWKYGVSLKNLNPFDKSPVAFNMAVKYFEEIKREGYTLQNNPYTAIYSDKDLNNIFLLYEAYQKELKKSCLIEYDDQLALVFKLCEIKPDLFEEMGFEHILIDEFQDTDGKQIELLKKMIDTTKFKSFMAVGDDSQSIFGFRHTSPEYMINFETYFGHFQDFPLLENHRSTRPIIDFANKVNAHAETRVIKDLIATKESDVAPSVQGFYSKDQEYEFIANDIKKRWDNGERDIAVLTSNRTEIAGIASKLTELGIPSIPMNPVPFMENCRVSALISFYDSFAGKSTQGFADYQNILASGALKNASCEQLETIATDFQDEITNIPRNLDTFKNFAKALDESGQDEVYEDFLEQLEFCEDMEELNEFMENFKIYGNKATHKREGKYDGISLITVHSAKGLEWDTTYLTLSSFDINSAEARTMNGFDEKIRKFFVGATRARENLIMTGTYCFNRGKNDRSTTPNRFLAIAYEDLGKVFDFSEAKYASYLAAEEQKKLQAKNEFTEEFNNVFKELTQKSKKLGKKKEGTTQMSDKAKDVYKKGLKPKAKSEDEITADDLGLD